MATAVKVLSDWPPLPLLATVLVVENGARSNTLVARRTSEGVALSCRVWATVALLEILRAKHELYDAEQPRCVILAAILPLPSL